MNINEAITREVEEFRDHLKGAPVPPTANEKQKHADILVRAFQCGVEWAQLTDVEGAEIEAVTSIAQAVAKGFECGLSIRGDRANSDSVLDANEVG